MSEIQFEVTTDLAQVANTEIETNFEAVREWLTEELAPYATMVVSPDSIADAKKTRAAIRKVADSIDAQRKAIKKVWNKPYEDYEAKCKELTGIVNEAVKNLDGQIKAMENEEKEEKRKRLVYFFDCHSYDIADYITFEDIFDPRWLNATFSEMDAANSIMEQIESFKEGLDTIRSMNSPYEAAMLSDYAKTRNLSKAIATGKQLEAIQKAEEERKAREAEAAFSEPEASDEDAEEPTVAPPQATAQFIRPMAEEEPPAPKVYTLRFEVEVTKQQAYDLKFFFSKNNIKYYKL